VPNGPSLLWALAFQFLPAAASCGAGTERSVTLFNCFVMARSQTTWAASSPICAKQPSPCSRAAHRLRFSTLRRAERR